MIADLLTFVEQAPWDRTARCSSKASRQQALEHTLATEIDSLERQPPTSQRMVPPETIRQFGIKLGKRLRGRDANFRGAYVSSLIGRVKLSDDSVRICETPATLEHAMVKDETAPADYRP